MPSGVAHIRKATIRLPMARLGPPSALPRFRWQQPAPNRPTPPNVGLSAEESANGFAWGEESILPYAVFEAYDRERREDSLDVLVLENGRLRAVVAPSLGGRLLALEDLVSGRDLVFRNPVFQPANLASLNAWFSGGIEWNGLIPGHSPFTCAPVFAGMRETPEGPILRLYEFDRIVEATWQVDLFLPRDAACLFAHGRIVNPADEARLAYWWTNIAVPMRPGMRVLSPADYSVEHVWPGNNLAKCEFPRPGRDGSYPENWENATSVFFRAPDAARLFIGAVDRDGRALLQSGTAPLRGRKFFYFGTGRGGQNWMDYLSRPGEGNYLEIQSGITPTQNQRFVLGPHDEIEWTEAFAPVQLDPERAHVADYRAAVAHAADALDQVMPSNELGRIDAFMSARSREPLDVRFSFGSPWGLRQEHLTGRPVARGLDFTLEAPGDCWDDLAQRLVISERNLQQVPNGVVVSRLWVERVEASARAQGMTWLHALILAIAALDRDKRDEARTHIEASLRLRATWLGYRMHALLADSADAAHESYRRAWSNDGAPAELAVEIAAFLMEAGRPQELRAFLDSLPPDVRDSERIALTRAALAADDGRFDEAEALLTSRHFATIREGETLLSDLWTSLRRGRLEAALGRAPSQDEIAGDLARHPLPGMLDLRMHVLAAQ